MMAERRCGTCQWRQPYKYTIIDGSLCVERRVEGMSVKLAVKHIKGCRALEYERKGVWNTCWGPVPWRDVGEAFVTTERRYGKKGRRFTRWLVFMCNCADCPARLHVDTDAIREWANRLLNKQEAH